MAICLHCGKDTGNTLGRKCPNCGAPLTVDSITNKKAVSEMDNDYDSLSKKYLGLGVVFPIIMLFIYFKEKNNNPLKMQSVLMGIMIGVILRLAFISVLLLKKIF